MTTPSSTPFSPGDVVLVRFTFTNQSGWKKRPAVILSVPAYHASRVDAIMMPLSTRAGGYFGDAPLVDPYAAGLAVATHLKAVVQTIPRSAIDSRLGSLATPDLNLVRSTLKAILGIA